MTNSSADRLGAIGPIEGCQMHVAEAVATRRTIRAFADKPVPFETMRRILDQARMAPSGCNFQPWEAIVLTGEPLSSLQERLLVSPPDDPMEYDFSAPGKVEKYQNRLHSLGTRMYNSMGIARGQKEQRAEFMRGNLLSFGAPVLLLCHFPKMMKEPQSIISSASASRLMSRLFFAVSIRVRSSTAEAPSCGGGQQSILPMRTGHPRASCGQEADELDRNIA